MQPRLSYEPATADRRESVKYDSDRLDRDLAEPYDIEMIAPHRRERQDRRGMATPFGDAAGAGEWNDFLRGFDHFRRLVIAGSMPWRTSSVVVQFGLRDHPSWTSTKFAGWLLTFFAVRQSL